MIIFNQAKKRGSMKQLIKLGACRQEDVSKAALSLAAKRYHQ
jgi:hypothetical protein